MANSGIRDARPPVRRLPDVSGEAVVILPYTGTNSMAMSAFLVRTYTYSHSGLPPMRCGISLCGFDVPVQDTFFNMIQNSVSDKLKCVASPHGFGIIELVSSSEDRPYYEQHDGVIMSPALIRTNYASTNPYVNVWAPAVLVYKHCSTDSNCMTVHNPSWTVETLADRRVQQKFMKCLAVVMGAMSDPDWKIAACLNWKEARKAILTGTNPIF